MWYTNIKPHFSTPQNTLSTLPLTSKSPAFLSDGYSAILQIIGDLILRAEKNNQKNYELQGIVLIDEIETHLHIALQKNILPLLTAFFPKIQFIVTTHSPFVLNSISNAVIYDLENKILVEDLSAYSYDGIVENYFDNDKYSQEIKQKIKQYEEFVQKLVDKQINPEERKKEKEIREYLEKLPDIAGIELKSKFKDLEIKRLLGEKNG